MFAVPAEMWENRKKGRQLAQQTDGQLGLPSLELTHSGVCAALQELLGWGREERLVKTQMMLGKNVQGHEGHEQT